MVQFGQIEAFIEVAAQSNLTRAADSMCLSQPTVTARIQQLEREIGHQLFTRTKRRLSLTEAGRTLLPYAQRSLQSMRQGQEALKHLRDVDGGKITIGATPFISTYLMPILLKSFRKEYPRVHIAVRTAHSEEVLEAVLTEVVQVGLVARARHPGIEAIKLHEDELALVVHPSHRFASRSAVSIEELRGEEMVLFSSGLPYYELTQSVLVSAGTSASSTMELDTVEAAKKMVEEGIGISLLPRLVVRRELEWGTLKEVPMSDAPAVKRLVYAIYRKGLDLGQVVQAFLRSIDEVVL
ncbi:MAG: LysR family transcriptional regulator [Chloroflexi bacterium]|nr:LysR family transcriptional regulator [Chloroflexota bacterium]